MYHELMPQTAAFIAKPVPCNKMLLTYQCVNDIYVIWLYLIVRFYILVTVLPAWMWMQDLCLLRSVFASVEEEKALK